MKRTIALLVLLFLAVHAPRRAAAETEWVLILDDSGSMGVGSKSYTNCKSLQDLSTCDKRDMPPNDPHRIAVIATLIFRSLLDPADHLTILTFKCCDQPQHEVPGLFSVLPNTIKDIRSLAFNEMTPFTGPMKEARRILDASKAAKKILLLVTDGVPDMADPITADEARKLLGLGPAQPPFEVVSLAIAPDADYQKEQVKFLGPLGKLETFLDAPAFVTSFTKVYADSIRSRPDSGTLPPGGKYEFKAPKYVSEVLVALATVDRIGTFDAKLEQAGKAVTPIDSGDSGCAPPRTPCHAYQVFKAKKDTDAEESWSLSTPGVSGQIAYGIILRYDLGAEILSMGEAKAGEEKEVIARLTYKGAAFNDPAFFKADGFEAHAVLMGVEAPLTLRPEDGSFVGKVKVSAPGLQVMQVRFRNKWLTVTADKPFNADAWIPLTLNVTPTPVDFGAWTGDRGKSERCVDLDFSKSVGADKVPIEFVGKNLPEGLAIQGPTGPVQGGKAHVCLVAPGCCSAYPATDKAQLIVRGVDPHYHPGALEIPIKFDVAQTPFLVCWWRVIAGVIGAILFVIIAYGFIKPFDFDAQEVFRLSGKEATLARASGRRLRELPGGKRGFYRDAKVAFDGSGGAVKPGPGAALIFKATKNDAVVVSKTTIEHKDPRTRKWVALDTSGGGPIYLRRTVVYRIGEIYFQLG